jgi:hypothetical protein
MNLGIEIRQLERNVWLGEGRFVPVETRALLRMVFESVHQVEWPNGKASSLITMPEPVLRTVLTYGYGIGILSSEDIAAATVHDETVRYLCANHRPTWQTVREFRRSNVPCLTEALAELFAKAAPARNFNPRLAATERLAAAIRADSAAMDD